MKILAVFIIILSIAIIVIPQLTDCQSQGLMLTLQDGRQIPMKCHWTAMGELALGITLVILGFELLIARCKETRINLGILGIVLGLFVILFPTVLIGVCSNAGMTCNSIMKPTLILSGGLVIVISLIIAIISTNRKEKSLPIFQKQS